MTTPAQRQKSQRYRLANKAREAARSKAWREARPGYSTKMAKQYRAKQKANLTALIAAAERVFEPLNIRRCLDLAGVPDYPGDLNACHAAEQTLDFKEREEYCDRLGELEPGTANSSWWACAHADARQRAQAFVRTIAARADGLAQAKEDEER